MNISVTDARGLFTKMLIAVYKEKVTPTSFLRSFFTTVETSTKELSIEVQRGTEKIAVDVERGTEGNRNSFSKSTEKIFVPPYYREYFDATELDLYDRLFGSTTTEISDSVFQDFLQAVADKLRMLQDKIERSYELQCSQVLQTGIVTLQAGTNINFKRKVASIVDNSGTPWSGANDPYAQIQAGMDFLRKVGKVQGGSGNAIVGSDAMAAFLNNAKVLSRGPLTNVNLDAIRAPQKNSLGAALFGRITCGSYNVNLWTYPEFYDLAGTSTPYIDPKNVILLPEAPKFVLGFAAVPQLLTTGVAVQKGAFLVGNYIDERNAKHIFDIKSAGVAIPVAVDQIYTMKVLS